MKQALVMALIYTDGNHFQQFSALTDTTGNFSLGGLAEGTYQLSVQKNGFAPAPDMYQEPVKLGPSRDAVALRLQPFGKISGKVTDSEGEPVPSVTIRALHAEIQDGRRSFRQDRSVSTDDRGQFRLWNLQPGEYYIVAAGRSGGTVVYVGTMTSGGVREGFAPVYYPAARDRASATAITITPGQEFAADLKIIMQPAYWVRGTLRNLAMRQAAKVEFLNEAGEVTAIRVMVNSATGRFEARDVVPGTYLLRASQGKGETEIRGEQQVQVGSADVDGVALELLPGVTVTGVVRDERKRGRCSMTLESTHESVAAASPFQANPGDDGTFAIHNVPAGKYRVRVRTYGAYVASLMSGAQDLSNGAELVVSPGTAPEPLEIVVRTDVGSVLGVIDPSAKVADRVWILLLPTADGEPERTLSFGGKFSFLSLAPGDYQAYLFKELDNIEFRNPDVLRGLKSESVHVTAGGSTTVTLKAVAQ